MRRLQPGHLLHAAPGAAMDVHDKVRDELHGQLLDRPALGRQGRSVKRVRVRDVDVLGVPVCLVGRAVRAGTRHDGHNLLTQDVGGFLGAGDQPVGKSHDHSPPGLLSSVLACDQQYVLLLVGRHGRVGDDCAWNSAPVDAPADLTDLDEPAGLGLQAVDLLKGVLVVRLGRRTGHDSLLPTICPAQPSAGLAQAIAHHYVPALASDKDFSPMDGRRVSVGPCVRADSTAPPAST
jgi:hypothetical protein